MTKTIILGERPPKKTELKPIKFRRTLMDDGGFECVTGCDKPADYKFVELVSCGYGIDNDGDSFDLIFAYQDPKERDSGVLYLGKWNDGVVK